jgi:hypothetical protein
MPRRPSPITPGEIAHALNRASAGSSGAQLAALLKRCHRDDLAKGFRQFGPNLAEVLAFVSGRQEMRAEVAAARLRSARRADREDRRPPPFDIPSGFFLVRSDVLQTLAAGEPVSAAEADDAP